MTARAAVGVFDDEEALLAAARACRARRLEIDDVLSPYPVHGIDAVAGIPRSRIAAACLGGGLTGLLGGLALQKWTGETDWPLDVGGKPLDSLPAYMVVCFELTVLCAALAVVATVIVRSRLSPRRRPRLEGLGTTDDRFALVVLPPREDPGSTELPSLLRGLGAREARWLGEVGR
jgi:hypothetical protein